MEIKTTTPKEEFLKEKFYFSYSSLTKLINDPKVFYNEYILGNKDVSDSKYLKEGQLLHCFVLEPENFDEKFVVLSNKVPGGGLKGVIDTVFNTYGKASLEAHPSLPISLTDFTRELLDELAFVNLYQSLTSDLKRLDKAITSDTIHYFNTLVEGEKKIIVDMDMIATAKLKAEAIMSNVKANELLTSTTIKVDVRKEMELQTDLNNYPFGLKGILDCVKIDYENETIFITDLKTTSKSLKQWEEDFKESEYMYWLQAIIYKELVLSLVPKDNDRPWKLVLTFLVVDRNNNVYPFKVSPKSLSEWELRTKVALDVALWHYTNHKYDLPYEYELNLVEL